MNLLDFKGATDRKLMTFAEDVPQQIKREVKTFEMREQQLIKDVS